MPKIEINLNENIYQNFLIEICRICDEIYLRERKMVGISFVEKEELALQAFRFLSKSLEEINKTKYEYFLPRKEFGEFCNEIKRKINEDLLAKNIVYDHILKGKLPKENYAKYLAIAALKILKENKKEFKVENINKKILRAVALTAHITNFSEILREEIKKGNLKILKKETGNSRYIG